MDRSGGITWAYGILHGWKPYGLGLQVLSGVDDEVPVPNVGRRYRPAVPTPLSQAVQYLKGKSSHRLLTEYAVLRKRYWGQHLWARGYWVASSGNATDKVWQNYIKNQTLPEPDDDFHVV